MSRSSSSLNAGFSLLPYTSDVEMLTSGTPATTHASTTV